MTIIKNIKLEKEMTLIKNIILDEGNDHHHGHHIKRKKQPSLGTLDEKKKTTIPMATTSK
jgi:hypothetical protein